MAFVEPLEWEESSPYNCPPPIDFYTQFFQGYIEDYQKWQDEQLEFAMVLRLTELGYHFPSREKFMDFIKNNVTIIQQGNQKRFFLQGCVPLFNFSLVEFIPKMTAHPFGKIDYKMEINIQF